jgi:hypothetical protein
MNNCYPLLVGKEVIISDPISGSGRINTVNDCGHFYLILFFLNFWKEWNALEKRVLGEKRKE